MIQFQNRTSVQTLDTSTKSEHKPALPTKRKRDSICGLQSFTRPFEIKPHEPKLHEKGESFRPIRVISRSQLPLTLVDTTTNTEFPTNRLFSAHIDVLEQKLGIEKAYVSIPKVLVARNEANKSLYAIERVQHHVYSLCKLASWLQEKEVAELWDPSRIPLTKIQRDANANGTLWWQQAAVQTSPTEIPVENEPKRIRVSMLRPVPVPISAPAPSRNPTRPIGNVEFPKHALDISEEGNVPINETMGYSSQPASCQQLCEGLVQQYLEALYMSKTSLAYFAKGPVSRARNAFTSSEEGALPMHELVTFLRSMLLSHSAMEKKYREKLSEIIKSIPPGSLSDDGSDSKSIAKTKRSKGKVKLSRNGVYPQEDKAIRKWWVSEMPSPDKYGEETTEQRIKRRVADLRIRETLAQLILMLEISALEALSTYRPPPEDGDDLNDETQTQVGSQPKPKKRKKKLQDIKVLMDLLLDKLCIWQSVEEDEVFDFDAKPSDPVNGKSGGVDRLRSFCVEVIVPFYMSRLPEQAVMINKKLGGPVVPSPPKRKAIKPPVTSRKSGGSKEPEQKKSRRSLARTATDTTVQHSKQRLPSLTRSTTDSVLIPGLKREGSEIPLSAIPFQRSPSRASSRGTMSQFKHLARREIDLSTPSEAATAKMRQKKRVEEELKDAISTLKKPNRGLAVGGYVDEVEKRGLGSLNRSRKPANPTRRILQDVQVSATPKQVRRTKDVYSRTPSNYRSHYTEHDHEYDAPRSSISFIPSSTVKPPSSIVPGTLLKSGSSRTTNQASVAETPSKGPGGRTTTLFTVRRPPDTTANEPPHFKLPSSTSTLAKRNRGEDTIFQTPSRPRSQHLDNATLTKTSIPMFPTPVKGVQSAAIDNTLEPNPTSLSHTITTPIKSCLKQPPAIVDTPPATSVLESGPQPKPETSIYDALGWNDDDDFI